MSAKDCPSCTHAVADRWCQRYFEHLALSQAETLRQQAEHIRELIGDKDAAQSKAEAALDMAEQYARKAGHDISRDDVLRYVEHYWELRGRQEKHFSCLETLHWDVLGIVRDLEDGIFDGRAADIDAVDLAGRVVKRLKAVNPYAGRRKSSELWPRPAAPMPVDVELPFGEAS
jgi:hypothetical protein